MFYTIKDKKVFKKLDGKKILITGGTGFIAYYLLSLLMNLKSEENIEFSVWVTVRDTERAKTILGKLPCSQKIHYVEYHFDRPLSDMIQENFDYIVHLAAPARTDVFLKFPADSFFTIVQGTYFLLDYAVKFHCENFLYCSSSTVYGDLHGENICESMSGKCDFTDFKNVYAMGKRSAENLCACFRKQYDLPVKVVRPSYIYGMNVSGTDSSVWSYIIAQTEKKEPIIMQNSGFIYRSVCYVKDVARAFLYVLLIDTSKQIFNISTDDTSIRGFAEIAALESNSELVFTGSQNISSEKSFFSNENLISLGWTPLFHISEGIKDSINEMNYSGLYGGGGITISSYYILPSLC